MLNNKSPWFSYPAAKPNAKLRLFCLPYAGGGGHIYIPWKDKLPAFVELCAIQLPGRGMRMVETPYTSVETMVKALTFELAPIINEKPYVFFGHSMGSLLTYELTNNLLKTGQTLPAHLFVAGRRAPKVPDPDPPSYNLSEPEFIKELERLNGTPKEVMENRELMELLMPTLRADFELCETYHYNNDQPLPVPITVFGGNEDDNASHDDLQAWQHHTSKPLKIHKLPGDHFFLHASEAQLLALLSVELTHVAARL